MEPGRTTFWMIGSRVAASLFATVCMYVTAGLVDVSAILKTQVFLFIVFDMFDNDASGSFICIVVWKNIKLYNILINIFKIWAHTLCYK